MWSFCPTAGQCKVWKAWLLDTFETIGECCFGVPIRAEMLVAVKKPYEEDDADFSPKLTSDRLRWEFMVMKRVKDLANASDNLMQVLGYNALHHELYLPLMEGGDVTKYFFDRDYRGLQQNSEEFVPVLIDGLLRGLGALHGVDVAHRDIKADNLLLRHNPTSPSFGVASVVITDFGYSYCKDINGERASWDLPGTLPYIAPEILRARVARKKGTSKVLTDMLKLVASLPQSEGNVEMIARLTEMQKLHGLAKDNRRRLADIEVLQGAQEAVGAHYQEEALGEYHGQIEALSWKKLDIYSAGILIWQFFHKMNHPFPDCVHNKTDQQWVTKLHKDKLRPEDRLEDVPSCLRNLYALVVASDAMPMAWTGEPLQRPTAEELRGRLMGPLGLSAGAGSS